MALPSDPLLHAAVACVADAGAVTRAVQRDLDSLRHITKDDRSPVTVADFAAQAIVAVELAAALGPVRIVGEEHARRLRQDEAAGVREQVVEAVASHRPGISAGEVMDAIDACDHDGSAEVFWTLDPVDGTKGFLRGQQYAIALARIEHGRVTHAAMGCPNLPADQSAPLDVASPRGTSYAAAEGLGAWELAECHDAEPARPLGLASHGGGEVRVCESLEASHSSRGDTHRILDHLGHASMPVRVDSQCKYALVARGQADAYLRLPTGRGYVEKIWDHAAGMLIAKEAGAVVSDMTGGPLDFGRGKRLEGNSGIICAVPGLHGRVILAIDELGIAAPA